MTGTPLRRQRGRGFCASGTVAESAGGPRERAGCRFTHLLASGQEGQGARRACALTCEHAPEQPTAFVPQRASRARPT